MEMSIKGNVCQFVIEYMEKRAGQRIFQEMKKRLSQEEKNLLNNPIPSFNWIPLNTFLNIVTLADKILGDGNGSFCRESAYYSAVHGAPKFFRAFIQTADPDFTIQKSSSFWKFIMSHGQFEIMRTSSETAIVCLYDMPISNKALCESAIGYFLGILELSGAKNTNVYETKCRNNGDEFCEFNIAWELSKT